MKKGRRNTKKLSAGDMEIMSLLWEHGPLTLSQAHDRMQRPLGYTTVQTRLNRLVDKGLASKSKQRPCRYAAAISPNDVSADHLELLVERVTGGSIVPLVAHLVEDPSLTREQVVQLKKLIQQAERRISEEGETQ